MGRELRSLYPAQITGNVFGPWRTQKGPDVKGGALKVQRRKVWGHGIVQGQERLVPIPGPLAGFPETTLRLLRNSGLGYLVDERPRKTGGQTRMVVENR